MSETIKNESFALTAFVWVSKVSLGAALVVLSSYYIMQGVEAARAWGADASSRLLAAVTRVQVVREYVKPESLPVADLIPIVASEQKLPAVVLQAIVEQESGGGSKLYRFEPDKYAQLKTKVKDSDSEIRMLASSHGVAQVMGFNALPRCGVHWSKLYDTRTGLECGAKILRENIDRHKEEKRPSTKLRLALRDYNGTGDAADNYATEVMAKIGELLFASLK